MFSPAKKLTESSMSKTDFFPDFGGFSAGLYFCQHLLVHWQVSAPGIKSHNDDNSPVRNF
jgi:hypothetical protein